MKPQFMNSLRKDSEHLGYNRTANVYNTAKAINSTIDNIVYYQPAESFETDENMTDDNPNRVRNSERYYKRGSQIVAVKDNAQGLGYKNLTEKHRVGYADIFNGWQHVGETLGKEYYIPKNLTKQEKKALKDSRVMLSKIAGQKYSKKDLKPYVVKEARVKIMGPYCLIINRPTKSTLNGVTNLSNGRRLNPDKSAPVNDWQARNRKLGR